MGRKKVGEKAFIMRLDKASEIKLKDLSQSAQKSQAAIVRELILAAVGPLASDRQPKKELA